MEHREELKELLDAKAAFYNTPSFIAGDPICVPHSFALKQDVEISALFTAILSWGNRTTIINSSRRIMQLMDNAPYQFITGHQETDLRRFLGFVHRTFNTTDLLCFISFLSSHYSGSATLEDAFVPGDVYDGADTGPALRHFHQYFFSHEHPQRTRKHISTPARNSACKRLNMFLRWMVRKDHARVDFGLWKKISPAQLVCPLDVHVARVACRLGLLADTRSNWANALQLTAHLRELNAADPAVYDFALFGLGSAEKF